MMEFGSVMSELNQAIRAVQKKISQFDAVVFCGAQGFLVTGVSSK
jgi:hypothetical protein